MKPSDIQPELDDLRRAFVDTLARYWCSPSCSPKHEARALLARIEKEKEQEQMLAGTHEWGKAVAEAIKPEPPKQRTAEGHLDQAKQYLRQQRILNEHGLCPATYATNEIDIALRLVRELRQERDELAKRIERAKAEIPNFRSYTALRILEGEE